LPSPLGPNDVRFRRALADARFEPRWPVGVAIRTLSDIGAEQVARDAHRLIAAAFDDVPRDFESWWNWLIGDEEYDPAMVFVAYDRDGQALGVAQCWAGGYLKDLAVAPAARGQGLGEALVTHVFASFQARGVAHVDLKTNRVVNAAAARLYQRLGMVEVGWAG
jgi:ribosomal protein S18 acetylase RimI-like enzyme